MREVVIEGWSVETSPPLAKNAVRSEATLFSTRP